MTAPTARIGLGATITFLTTGEEFEVTSLDLGELTRTAHETTHLGTSLPSTGDHGSRTFIPGKVTDPGNITMDVHVNMGALDLIEGAKERVRITLGLESGQTTPDIIESDAFVIKVGGMKVEPDGKIMQSLELKKSGNVDYTPAT